MTSRVSRRHLAAGAGAAIRHRLAGLFRLGLRSAEAGAEDLDGSIHEALRRAERREIADDIAISRKAREVLGWLTDGGLSPVVLKGRPLAETLWPRPWMRPPGDLDILIESAALQETLAVLGRHGYGTAEGYGPGRWQPRVASVTMSEFASSFGIDIHIRPFSTVGGGIPARDLLDRAVPAAFHDVPIRVLDPSDEVLFSLVHAVKHCVIHPKWVLDLLAARLTHPSEVWARAAERAATYGASRPFWAARRMVGCRHLDLPPALARRILPPLVTRAALLCLVVPRPRPAGWVPSRARSYVADWLLEDRLKPRMRRFLGEMERLWSAAGRRMPRRRRRPSRSEVKSRRWVEGALVDSRSGPIWLGLRGSSMAPALRDGDELLVAPMRAGESLREGEVLVLRTPGRLVVHRLVRRLEGQVVTRGDACPTDDAAISTNDVLARVIAVHRSTGAAHFRVAPVPRRFEGEVSHG